MQGEAGAPLERTVDGSPAERRPLPPIGGFPAHLQLEAEPPTMIPTFKGTLMTLELGHETRYEWVWDGSWQLRAEEHGTTLSIIDTARPPDATSVPSMSSVPASIANPSRAQGIGPPDQTLAASPGVSHVVVRPWLVAATAATAALLTFSRRLVLERAGSRPTSLSALLGGVFGIDKGTLERVARAGLADVDALERIDHDALSFWTSVPVPTLRDWTEVARLLRWEGVEWPEARGLVDCGIRSLEALAEAAPGNIWTAMQGAGLRAGGEAEVASWIQAARETKSRLASAPALDVPMPA